MTHSIGAPVEFRKKKFLEQTRLLNWLSLHVKIFQLRKKIKYSLFDDDTSLETRDNAMPSKISQFSPRDTTK